MNELEQCEAMKQIQCEGRLTAIETKLDSILEKLEDSFKRSEKNTQRIEGLEKWQTWLLGSGAAIGIISLMIWDIIKVKIGA